MAQIATLTLNNGASTPVATTWAVETGQQGFTTPATWYYKTTDSVLGWLRLSGLKKKAPKSQNSKVSVKLEMPKLATMGVAADGATPMPTRVSTGFAMVEFTIPDNFSSADRANMVAYLTNALSDPQIKNMVLNLEVTY